ncbi:hypothetical protein D9M69_716860 [compost metagenome]
MQVGQRLRIVKPLDLRHHAFEQTEKALGLGDEAFQPPLPIRPVRRTRSILDVRPSALIEQPRGARFRLLGRQVQQGQVVAALEVAGVLFEGRAALLVDQPGQRLRK